MVSGKSNSYLNRGWVVEADSLDILHDLWITVVGLQKCSTGVGNGTLLTFFEVVNKDIVVLLPGARENMLRINTLSCSCYFVSMTGPKPQSIIYSSSSQTVAQERSLVVGGGKSVN